MTEPTALKTAPLHLEIAMHDEQWQHHAPLEIIANEAIAAAMIAADEHLPKHSEVSLVFTNDAAIQDLNKDWREKDKATNVLSFPALSEDEWDNLEHLPEILLGDIILAFETIEKEALEGKKAFRHHLTHLIIHGFLHLLGYDHIEEDMANEMEALEVEALKRLNIADPYQPID